MPFNYLGDLCKKEMVNKLQDIGHNIKNVHELNLILEKMGILYKNGTHWFTTKEGVKYTIYHSQCNADVFHPIVVDLVSKYLKK